MQLDAIDQSPASRASRFDLRILGELQPDGSLTNVELARRVHRSPSPCEHDEVMERYFMTGDSAT